MSNYDVYVLHVLKINFTIQNALRFARISKKCENEHFMCYQTCCVLIRRQKQFEIGWLAVCLGRLSGSRYSANEKFSLRFAAILFT